MENIEPVFSEESTLSVQPAEEVATEDVSVFVTPEVEEQVTIPVVKPDPPMERKAAKPRKVIFPKKDTGSSKIRNVPRFS